MVQDEEAIKQKLCEDLSNLVTHYSMESGDISYFYFVYVLNHIFIQVQESSNAQLSRLEELKRRLEALNPSRSSITVPYVRFLCIFML